MKKIIESFKSFFKKDKIYTDNLITITSKNYLEYKNKLKNFEVIDGRLIINDGVELELNKLKSCISITLYNNSTLCVNNIIKINNINFEDGSNLIANNLKECNHLHIYENTTFVNNNLEKIEIICLFEKSKIVLDNLLECSKIWVRNNCEMEEYLYNKFPNSEWFITDKSTNFIINKDLPNAIYKLDGVELNREDFINKYYNNTLVYKIK